MRRVWVLFALLLIAVQWMRAGEFTVLVYNVENLFDLDRVALYGDYEQGGPGTYGTGPLSTCPRSCCS